jgi:hypothetical protein
MQYFKKALFIFAGIVACIACATTADKSLSSTRAEGVNFNALRTFSWQPDAGDSINNMSIFDNQILRNRMHRAIEKELANRGVKPGTDSAPDMSIQLVVHNKGLIATQTRSDYNNNYPYNNRYPYNNGSVTTSTPTFSQHREVIVNCYDAKKNLIWSGAIIKDYKSAPDLQKNIENDVAQLMSQYPKGEKERK